MAADEPFLTNYPVAGYRGAYHILQAAVEEMEAAGTLAEGWHGLGLADTMSHAHRLTMPVMLTSGTVDVVCPPDSIEPVFELLTGTKCYMSTLNMPHGHNREFTVMAAAWLRMHA